MLALVGEKRKRAEEEDNYGPMNKVAVSEVEVGKFEFSWSLSHYSMISNSFNELKSPVFEAGGKFNHSWQIKLIPRKMFDGEEYLSLHLLLADIGDGCPQPTNRLYRDTVKARFQINLLGADGRPGKQAGKWNMELCRFKKLGIWGYDRFILSKDLDSSECGYLEDDILKIHCVVWVEGDLKHYITNGPTEDESEVGGNSRLASDYGNFYKKSVLTDIRVVTVNGKIFPAHKAILAARSSVFAALFTAGYLEHQGNCDLAIDDFPDKVVKLMLDYIYSGTLEDFTKWAPSLLQISEKYDLPELKKKCEYIIMDNLTIENAADIYLLAQLYHADILKPQVVMFMNENRAQVKETESCLRVTQSHPEVFVDLF